MKLSVDQINHIKSRIEKKGFKYLDVQAEIIDHMASAIEDKISENPTLSVDEAYDLTYAELGIFAFSNFEESITKRIKSELFQSFLRKLKNLVFSFFIFIPIMLSLLAYTAQNSYPQNFLTICFIFMFGYTVLIGLAWLKIYQKDKFLKKYLTFRISFGVHLSISYVMFYLLFYSNGILTNGILNGPALVVYIAIFVLLHLAQFYAAKSMVNKIKNLNHIAGYPEH